MPSPIGHALAGLAVAWTTEAAAPDVCGRSPRRCLAFEAACLVAAAAPDADLLWRAHRTVTHSVTATAAVALVAAVVALRTRRPLVPVVLACAAAHASHILLDWLGADTHSPYGVQFLWPFSHRWFISGLDWFPETARRDLFARATILQNLRAAAHEAILLGPIAWLAWRYGADRRARQLRR